MLEADPSASRLAKAFARFLGQRTAFSASEKQAFENCVMALSHQQSQGHNCIELDDNARTLVLASGLANPAGQQTTLLPLVVDRNLLYLQRYWFYENRLAMQIMAMIRQPAEYEWQQSDSRLEQTLDRYFDDSSEQPDWQRAAAKMAVKQKFSIITGGPGTGKTTTVVKILALLQELNGDPLFIALAAPTGKAAMRLQEAVGNHKASLPCAETIKLRIPDTVSTLHRLLGARPPSPYFRHDAANPLVHDLVVVDEASMVDLALMSKLLNALKPGARLILLGDKDQLASVESGAVLADLAEVEALRDQVTTLKLSHRFDDTIKKLADAVNLQQADAAWQLLQNEEAATSLLSQQLLIDYVTGQQAPYLKLIESGVSFDDIYRAFNRFQVLCSNRHGTNGVAEINRQVEQRLAAQKLIHLTGLWYSGRPVIVTQNNPSLNLYNGDIGLCLPDKDRNGKLMVFFQRADGIEKKYLPSRVPNCETVFAMTIHKSQGSEFEEVLIALPDVINPVLTKELLYTAITRAKKTIRLVAGETVFKAAVRQKVARVTGLVNQFQSGN